MQIDKELFDRVVYGLTNLVNIRAQHADELADKLEVAAKDVTLRQQEIQKLKDELSEILLLNQNLREEVAKLKGMDVVTQRAECKKDAIKLLRDVAFHFKPLEEPNFVLGFRHAITFLEHNLK